MKICQSLDDALAEIREQLTPERYIQSQIESMADAPAMRQKLHAVLDDPAYGRANLLRITDSDDIAKRHYFDNSQICSFSTYQGTGCNHF